MAFPPEFSSTLTYANRYDLDEIDVFLEGDSSNPMFFDVSGLPENLGYGKHYFYLSLLSSRGLEYKLKDNSKILFEFKSLNNVVLRSDVTKIKQKNGTITGFVEVLKDPLRTYEEVEDGQGTLTIVGSLQHKVGSQNPIPGKFIGAMNYRCVFPIQIRKNLINSDAPILIQTEHKLNTIRGQFSFVRAHIPTRKYAKSGTEYDTLSGKPILSAVEADDTQDIR